MGRRIRCDCPYACPVHDISNWTGGKKIFQAIKKSKKPPKNKKFLVWRPKTFVPI